MKLLLKLTAFFLTAVIVFLSCNKPPEVQPPPPQPPPPPPPPPAVNLPPVARAGVDTTIKLSSCGDTTSVELDGSASIDPEGKTLVYTWNVIARSGSPAVIRNRSLAKTKVENLSAGEHFLELRVTDTGGLSARDTVLIRVQQGPPKEYDLDITFGGNYSFTDNYKDCYYFPCTYYDETIIQGQGNFLPLGNFKVYFSEYADSAALTYADASYFSISRDNMNNTAVYGTSSINLKKLIQQGGGSFNGSFTISDGSARRCDHSVVYNHPPLNVTGNLDTATKKVTFRVSGKTYF